MASEIEQKITPYFANSSLNVVAIENGETPVSVHARANLPTELQPATTADPGQRRARLVLAARLAPSILARQEERRWLAGMLGVNGKSFTFGAQLWFAVHASATDAEATAEAARLEALLVARFGGTSSVAWSLVDETFSLTATSLSGGSPLPDVLRRLFEQLHG